MPRSIAVFLFAAIAAFTTAARAVSIPTVPVGNSGNAADVQYFGTIGAVAYDYRFATTEVTLGQYTAFLKAVAATDTYGLYNPSMATNLNIAGIARSGVSGSFTYSVIGSSDDPVTYVSWGDAARFTNWLHNGQPGLVGPAVPQNAASTESGAYTLNGANTSETLSAVTRNVGARWFLPTQDEWYKAAFHQPAAQGGDADNYWDYPTRSNSEPYSDQPPGSGAPTQSKTANFYKDDGISNGYDDGFAVTGSASYSASQNYLSDVGAYTLSSSFYGTFDQGGNASEWNETLLDEVTRGYGGGSAGDLAFFLQASGGAMSSADPTIESSFIGFRVANIPEPGTAVLSSVGLLGLIACGRRRRNH